MLKAGRRRTPTHHPGQFFQSRLAADLNHRAGSHRAVIGLAHHEVPVGVGGHLRQVGDDDDLRVCREVGQPGADIQRRLTTEWFAGRVDTRYRQCLRAPV